MSSKACDIRVCYGYLNILVGMVNSFFSRNNRAVGIEFFNDKFIRPNADPAVRTVRASRLIVISAGTLGSSAILERSGIGAAQRLKKIGVPQIVDLPGVGENYQGAHAVSYICSSSIEFLLDHLLVGAAYFVDQVIETYDALTRGDPDETKSKHFSFLV